MGLVDYTSDSSSSSPSPSLPPLPPTFHDLYAHTVRTSTMDDPTLHQGRRRQIPHVQGQWPSHLYIEWRPSSTEHALLESFLSKLRSKLGAETEMTGFLSSDVGVPLPLHVSLSRPFVLGTEERDDFLPDVRDKIERSRIGEFGLGVAGVEWHRTEESGRSFLVLRVRSCGGGARTEAGGRTEAGEEDEGEDEDGSTNLNPELTVFLTRCNTVVEKFGQPKLYEWADGSRVGDAFHISIAWSFAEPDEELRGKTAEVFADPEFAEAMKGIEIRVDGIKAKIGNVVNHIPLRGVGKRDDGNRSRGLFGI